MRAVRVKLEEMDALFAGTVRPSDSDCFVERRGHFLFGEFKTGHEVIDVRNGQLGRLRQAGEAAQHDVLRGLDATG